MKKTSAKLKDIKVWYKFKPSINIWFSKMKNKTHWYMCYDETWYGGAGFYSGLFVLVQCRLFAIHIRVMWWGA